MNEQSRMFRRTVAISILLWLGLVAALAAWRVHWVLSGPRDGETYVYTTSFQLFAFAYAQLPWLVLLLAVIVIGEYWIFRRRAV